jgi:hypothetical protein
VTPIPVSSIECYGISLLTIGFRFRGSEVRIPPSAPAKTPLKEPQRLLGLLVLENELFRIKVYFARKLQQPIRRDVPARESRRLTGKGGPRVTQETRLIIYVGR